MANQLKRRPVPQVTDALHVSRVVGLQFGIGSPEFIRQGSVAEINSTTMYTADMKPAFNGLMDTRMGVLEPGLICQTDGLDYIHTPGYHGHIELVVPVFYKQFVPKIVSVLSCHCLRCSRLLIDKKSNWHLNKNMPAIVDRCKKDGKICGNDTYNGCGYVQPTSITQKSSDGFVSIVASWKASSSSSGTGSDDISAQPMRVCFTPEMVLSVFRHIHDEDISFIGMCPRFARPEWMICTVLSVSPPAARPFVKHSAQQHADDDLTFFLMHIIKNNNMLKEKMRSNAPPATIERWTTMLQGFLQLYVGAMVDNRAGTVTHRSGRPLKSLHSRLGSKEGRVRGNLMAKRVDQSARSVITADPNLRVEEIGVPKRIAMNLTKKEEVNARNRDFLSQLVLNGANKYPGANILERRNGLEISLKSNVDRQGLVLEIGDKVHRHMLDGDVVIFNRQPSLHRPSMQGHFARVLDGDTFRLNLSVTKAYNADFDGDEMNLHYPQGAESDAELRGLAAVPYNFISPANNTPIVGIFQDSLLGAHLFTDPKVHVTMEHAMNLLMPVTKVDVSKLHSQARATGGAVSSYSLLSQIMPPLTMTNGKMRIRRGEYLGGQLKKGLLGARSSGILHRVCNDFGHYAATQFVDNLQNLVNRYIMAAGFSVGISDLISNQATRDSVATIIQDKKQAVKDIQDQIYLGTFENNTGRSNLDEFENRVAAILNQASSEAGDVGQKSLAADNRFLTMVNAGSKGDKLNISFMISCLGQQNVEGKRVPYGFEHRTLPHFAKFDDSPAARGFVESSYIDGLTAQELFMHAQGGRIGLIDTAVKTAQTGYLQREFVKGLEDQMVFYDGTVRDAMGRITQFRYGDDGVNSMRVESQGVPMLHMSGQAIHAHFLVPPDTEEWNALKEVFADHALWKRFQDDISELRKAMQPMIEDTIRARDDILKYVYQYRDVKLGNGVDDDTVRLGCAVNFRAVIDNVSGQLQLSSHSVVDLTPMQALTMIQACLARLNALTFAAPSRLFLALFTYHLAPIHIVLRRRFHKAGLALLLDTITSTYMAAIVDPGEMVGITAAQSIGEVSTQMTLNTFHFAGVASKSNVTRGVPRIREIAGLTPNMKNPSICVALRPEDRRDRARAQTVMHMMEHTRLRDVVISSEVCFDPDDYNTLIEADAPCIAQFRAFEDFIQLCNDPATATGRTAFQTQLCDSWQSSANSPMRERKSMWIVRLEMDAVTMLEKNITMDDVHFALRQSYGGGQFSCVYSDFNAEKLIFRLRPDEELLRPPDRIKRGKHASIGGSELKVQGRVAPMPLDVMDQTYRLDQWQNELLDNVVLRGVAGIQKVTMRKSLDNVVPHEDAYENEDHWVLDTLGTNLKSVLGLDYIDATRTISNDIMEVNRVLGIEACRRVILSELIEVVEFDGAYIGRHNYMTMVARMTVSHSPISMNRFGINQDNIGPIAKASFEETMTMFINASVRGELDIMRGASANTMLGQEGHYGTGAFQVHLSLPDMSRVTATTDAASRIPPTLEQMEKAAAERDMGEEMCRPENMMMRHGAANIVRPNYDMVNDAYELDF